MRANRFCGVVALLISTAAIRLANAPTESAMASLTPGTPAATPTPLAYTTLWKIKNMALTGDAPGKKFSFDIYTAFTGTPTDYKICAHNLRVLYNDTELENPVVATGLSTFYADVGSIYRWDDLGYFYLTPMDLIDGGVIVELSDEITWGEYENQGYTSSLLPLLATDGEQLLCRIKFDIINDKTFTLEDAGIDWDRAFYGSPPHFDSMVSNKNADESCSTISSYATYQVVTPTPTPTRTPTVTPTGATSTPTKTPTKTPTSTPTPTTTSIMAPLPGEKTEQWFTMTNFPDGQSHTAFVTHGGNWNPEGIAAFSPDSTDTIRNWSISGFSSDERNQAEDIASLAYSSAYYLNQYSNSAGLTFIPDALGRYWLLAPDRVREEYRMDLKHNVYKSHFIKRCNVFGWGDYDYTIDDPSVRQDLYEAAIWAMIFQYDRTAEMQPDKMFEIISEVFNQVAGPAFFSELGSNILQYSVTYHADEWQKFLNTLDPALEKPVVGSVKFNAELLSQCLLAVNSVLFVVNGIEEVNYIHRNYILRLLYYRLVQLPATQQRLNYVEEVIAANPDYDPILTNAVHKVKDEFSKLLNPISTQKGAEGWAVAQIQFIQELMNRKHSDYVDDIVMNGGRLVGNAAQIGTEIAAILFASKFAGPVGIVVSTGCLIWDVGTGLQMEREYVDACQIMLNLDQLFTQNLRKQKSHLDLRNIDYNTISRVCMGSNICSYNGYRYLSLFSKAVINPNTGLFYWIEWIIQNVTGGNPDDFVRQCQSHASCNLAIDHDEDIAFNSNLLYQCQGSCSEAYSDIIDYAKNILEAKSKLQYKPVNMTMSSNTVCASQGFSLSTYISPLAVSFDAYVVIIGPKNKGRASSSVHSFILGKPTQLSSGIRPLITAVPGLQRPFAGTLFSIPAIPASAEGSYNIIIALVPSGVKPLGVRSAIPGYVDQIEITVLPQ